MNISCIIIDDEPIARKGLQSYADRIPFLQVKHVLPDALAAMKFLSTEAIDLMILDINMPELTGLQLLKSLEQPPPTIMITAHPEHAVESYELDVIDYIIKPVSFDRFLKAVNKAKEFIELKSKSVPATPDYFFIKEGLRIEKINFQDILFIESLQNYSAIHTEAKKYMALLSLKLLEENLPASSFVKVHKSYIVNVQKINSIEGDEVIIGSYRIPISRANKDAILNTIVGANLLKRK
jgi:DNA-binding LytR/AlgR family response regulator